MALELSPGTVCVADGRTIEISGDASMTHVEARDMATGDMIQVPISHIHVLPARKDPHEVGLISQAEWDRCTALAKDLAPLRQRSRITRRELERLAKRHHLGVRQLQRARAIYEKDPRVSALVRNKGGRPDGLNLLDPAVDALIKHGIKKYYCKRERPPKSYLVLRIQSLARRVKLPPPSRNAILTRLAQEDAYRMDVARLGGKAAKQRWEPRPGKLAVSRPLELIQIDHTPADVEILSDDRLTVIGRPWVTVAIDVFSRCVVGMYISMDAPSSVSVSLCIEHLVLPKPENADEPNLWPMYGKPERILVDNGKDFRAQALIRGCQQHGINLEWRPVRTPHYGAHIERLIGSLMKLAHLLPGTTFSNVREKGDYKSAKRARLTLDEFRAWMTQMVCQHYHVRRHRALGVAPRVAWERGRTQDGRYVPPALMPNPTDFRMDFLPFEYRKIRRTGIEFRASRYWHADLTPLLRLTEEVPVRYDPRDRSRVWVRHEGQLIEAPAIAGLGVGDLAARQRVDAATQAELEAAMDAGFAACDRIEVKANRATAAARRNPFKARTKTAPAPVAGANNTPPMPPMREDNAPAMPVETPSAPDGQGDLFGFPPLPGAHKGAAMAVEEWN